MSNVQAVFVVSRKTGKSILSYNALAAYYGFPEIPLEPPERDDEEENSDEQCSSGVCGI
jgi:hypothetical protein